MLKQNKEVQLLYMVEVNLFGELTKNILQKE
jgi:hypothetical protein